MEIHNQSVVFRNSIFKSPALEIQGWNSSVINSSRKIGTHTKEVCHAIARRKKQVKRTISYARHEKRVLNMEDYLMGHYGYDRSQLNNVLTRERYHQIRFL